MMNSDRRPHVQKGKKDIRERKARAVQPGPGVAVEAQPVGAGSGEKPQDGGEVNPSLHSLEDLIWNTNPGGVWIGAEGKWVVRPRETPAPPAGPAGGAHDMVEREGVVREAPRRMTVKEKLVRWVGKRTGKAIGKRMGKVDDGTQKLAATTVGDKGIVAGGKSGLVALAVIALIRGMGVQLWDEDQDLEMSVAIVTVIGAIGTAYGSLKNVYTNWHLAKQNGVSVTRQKQPEEK